MDGLFKLISEMYYYLLKHKSLMGIKSFLFFLFPNSIRTKVRVNEKGYLNTEFVKQFSEINSIAQSLWIKNSNRCLAGSF